MNKIFQFLTVHNRKVQSKLISNVYPVTRNLSCTTGQCCQNTPNVSATFNLKAGPWGHLNIETSSLQHIVIEPLNAELYPGQNRVIFSFSKSGEEIEYDHVNQLFECHADNNIVLLRDKQDALVSKDLACHIHLPYKMDITGLLRNESSIAIEKSEGENINIKLEEGKCLLKSIQGLHLNLESSGGDIIMKKFIQANTFIKASKATKVEGDRIQGLKLNIETENGDIHIKDVYADKSYFTTQTGSIHLGQCHREAHVDIMNKGNLIVDSIDGNLKARLQTGDISLYTVKHDNIDLHTQIGDIDLKMLESIDSQVDLNADEINIDDSLLVEGSTSHTSVTGHLIAVSNEAPTNYSSRLITAKTECGSIRVQSQNWLNSLKLMSNVD